MTTHSFARPNRAKKSALIAGAAALTLALGSIVSYAAWNQTQDLTVAAQAKTLGMQYSTDGGTTWVDFDGSFELANLENLSASEDHNYDIQFKNNGSTTVTLSAESVTASGTAFGVGTAAEVYLQKPSTALAFSTSVAGTTNAADYVEESNYLIGTTIDAGDTLDFGSLGIATSDGLDESYSGTTIGADLSVAFTQ